MKKKMMFLALGLLLIGGSLYAASGDLIVNGNLGVGTSSPINPVQVNANANNLYAVRILQYGGTGSGGISGGLYVQTANTTAVNLNDSVLRLDSNGGTKPIAVFQNNGKVGIGTTNPGHPLDIAANSGANNIRLLGRQSDSLSSLMFSNWGSTVENYIQGNGSWIRSRADGGFHFSNGTTPVTTYADSFTIQNLSVVIGNADPGTHKLYVAGTAYSTGGWQTSDARFKKNLQAIDEPLNKVLTLNGVSYEWKTDEYKDKGFPDGRHYGVIAQEIEKVLPETVSTGPDGSKSVAYTEIIPVLIEAIKEQQKEIEQLKKALNLK